MHASHTSPHTALRPHHSPLAPARSCLLYWLHLNRTRNKVAILATSPKADERHEADWQTVAASLAFVEEQNAGADCLPCIRLLSGVLLK